MNLQILFVYRPAIEPNMSHLPIVLSAKNFFKDARHFQIVYLSLFLLYGIYALGWEVDSLKYTVLIGTCLIVQAIGAFIYKLDLKSLKSGMITALGLCLLLKSNSYETLALAAIIAIASKFLIRYRGKHIFNPANIGIIVAVLFTGDAWISPGQWGSNTVLLYFFGAAALIVLLKVGRLDTSLIFLGAFVALEIGRTILYLGWGWDVLIHKLLNGSFLLFVFFMITDPMTTPNHGKGRIIWAIVLAGLSFLLTNWLYINTAPIWALFIISPVTALLDRKYKGVKFEWRRKTSSARPITKYNESIKPVLQ